ncbi:MAG: type 2 isopentenyl-diphosphate Delta-isomerase [Candidatus Izemoplasmataceae bacterium]
MNKKDDHIKGALDQPGKPNGFDHVRFIHDALGETAYDQVSLSAAMAGREFPFPIYINAMTGGGRQSESINRRLAMLAKHFGMPMAVGSVSAALKDPTWARSFTVIREVNPDGFIMANLGAEVSVEKAQEAVDLLKADMLQIHLNPLQELIMPEGDDDFSHTLKNIQAILKALKVPIMVKEVGFGLSKEALEKLSAIGIERVDVSGKGGTNFAIIENARRDHALDYLEDFGLSTVESLIEAASFETMEIHASGGIRNPLDALKAIRLGASMVGMSKYFLNLVGMYDHEDAIRTFEAFIDGMRRVMVLLGAKDLDALKTKPIVFASELVHYRNQRL